MEKYNTINNNHAHETGWEAWDAVPRDGPAVFIVDTRALDQEGQLRGRWISLEQDETAIVSCIEGVLGRPPDDGWAIVDQVGLGRRMVPADLTVGELPDLARQLAAADGDG